MRKFNAIDIIFLLILIIGGFNWMLVGLFNLNLVNLLFKPIVAQVIYSVVGIAAVYMLYVLVKPSKS